MEIYKNLNLENMENEIWKDVVGYEGLYQISNMGRVKSLNYNGGKGKVGILKQSFSDKGYLKISLKKNRKTKTFKTHRLVAIAFIPNVENKLEVDHINTIRTDNRVENLRWSTRKENNNNELTRKHNSESQKGKKHTEETKEKLRGRNGSNYKGFICIFPDGNITEEMGGEELGELLGVSDSTIIRIAKSGEPYKPFPKRLKHLNGIRIYYAEDYKELVGDNNVIA